MPTRSVCWDKIWGRTTCCISYTCNVWRRNAFACGLGGWICRRRPYHSGHNRRVCHPSGISCGPGAAKGERRTCCKHCTHAWVHESTCACWEPACWRRLWYSGDTSWPVVNPNSYGSAYVVRGWRRWRSAYHILYTWNVASCPLPVRPWASYVSLSGHRLWWKHRRCSQRWHQSGKRQHCRSPPGRLPIRWVIRSHNSQFRLTVARWGRFRVDTRSPSRFRSHSHSPPCPPRDFLGSGSRWSTPWCSLQNGRGIRIKTGGIMGLGACAPRGVIFKVNGRYMEWAWCSGRHISAKSPSVHFKVSSNGI